MLRVVGAIVGGVSVTRWPDFLHSTVPTRVGSFPCTRVAIDAHVLVAWLRTVTGKTCGCEAARCLSMVATLGERTR